MTKVELKLCPFCGKQPTYSITIDGVITYVRCDNPHCNQRISALEIAHDHDIAVMSWNTRPVEDALRIDRDQARKNALREVELLAEEQEAHQKTKEALEQERKWRNYYEEHYTDHLRDSGAICESLERYHAALKEIHKALVSTDPAFPYSIIANINHITTECLNTAKEPSDD